MSPARRSGGFNAMHAVIGVSLVLLLGIGWYGVSGSLRPAAPAQAAHCRSLDAVHDYAAGIVARYLTQGQEEPLLLRSLIVAKVAEACWGSRASSEPYVLYMETAGEIGEQFTLPKALAGQRAFNAGLLAREAELNIRNAHSMNELNAGYDKSVRAIKEKTAAEIALINIEDEKVKAANLAESHAAALASQRGRR